MERDEEILPDGIIKQRIQKMAEDLDPTAWEYCKNHAQDWTNQLFIHYNLKCWESSRVAAKLVAAGWCPGPIGEKPILDKYFKI